MCSSDLWPSAVALLPGLWHPTLLPWLALAIGAGTLAGLALLRFAPSGWRPWLGTAALLAWLAVLGA